MGEGAGRGLSARPLLQSQRRPRSLGGGRVRALLLLCPRRPLVSSHLGRGPASHQPCHHSLSKPVALGGDAGPHLCLRVWSWGCRPARQASSRLLRTPVPCSPAGRCGGEAVSQAESSVFPLGFTAFAHARFASQAGAGPWSQLALSSPGDSECGVCLVAGSVPLFKPSGPSALPVRLLDV